MHHAVKQTDKERNKKHEVWQGTFDIKECRTEKFILQKLNYMQDNPCTERWKLSLRPTDYAHSSAAFYNCGKENNYHVKDYIDVLHLIKNDV